MSGGGDSSVKKNIGEASMAGTGLMRAPRTREASSERFPELMRKRRAQPRVEANESGRLTGEGVVPPDHHAGRRETRGRKDHPIARNLSRREGPLDIFCND